MINDFFFNIDQKKYKCYASTICSFSPVVCNLISNNQFLYNFDILKDPNGDFEQFLKLINGFEIDISMSNAAFLNEISKVLQIQSLFKATESFLNSISRTPENLLNLFESYVSHQIPCPELVKEIISKWDNIETLIDIPNEGLLSLSVSSLEYLFSSDTFQQNKEDTLFDLIIKIIEQNGQTYSTLFSYCDPTKLTSNQLLKMIEIVSFDSIPQQLIDSLEQRFVQGSNLIIETYSDSTESRILGNDSKSFKFNQSYDDSFVFKGIFHYILTYSSNVFDKCVRLSCGSDKKRYLNSLFEYDDIERYHWDNYSSSSKDKSKLDIKNAWILISLPSHKIRLDDYTFVVLQNNTKNRPKSWIIYARNHNDPPDVWQKIDEKNLKMNQNVFLAKERYIKTFTIPNNRNFYSQFKIQFTENQFKTKNGGEQEIALCGIEFYGTLARI